MEYSCIFFNCCSETKLQKLELLQNLCLRIPLCAFPSTPIIAFCAETYFHPSHTADKNCLFSNFLKPLHPPHFLRTGLEFSLKFLKLQEILQFFYIFLVSHWVPTSWQHVTSSNSRTCTQNVARYGSISRTKYQANSPKCLSRPDFVWTATNWYR